MVCNRFPTLLLFLLAVTVSAVPVFAGPRSITYQRIRTAGIWVDVVTVNMNDPDVRLAPAVARWGIGHSESFQRFLNRTRPTAAITGTFFDTRSLRPVGDIVVEGTSVHRGVVGTAIGIGWNNEVDFIPTKRAIINDWSGYRHVLAAGPRILSGGRNSVAPWNEGFSDGGIYARRPRAAIGLTKWKKVILAVIKEPVHLTRLASVMKRLGCTEAAVLDGGSSTAMYFRGRVISRPSRRLTNILVAYDEAFRYEQALSHLAPRLRSTVAGRREEKVETIELVLP